MPSNANAPAKWGATHAAAMGRLGLKELAQILPATNESIQPIEEMGLAGNALPQEVYQERHEATPHVDKNIEIEM